MKMAREYALLGHYDTAAAYFKGAMRMIDQCAARPLHATLVATMAS